MSKDAIIVAGAREHNLKNITVHIPRNAFTVVTGLSGSGKSSLAFDTIFAEGQRKYVESLSAYARQFLEQMQKPDVEYIEGLSPAISIEQRTAGSNPRSIVATTTEIHDYLRLLFAHIGTPHCPQCRQPVSRQSAEDIVNQLMALAPGTRLMLLAPLIKGRKGEHAEVLEAAQKQGYVRVRVDGDIYEIEDVPRIDKKKKHTIDIVIDRIAIKENVRSRLTDSVEQALKSGEGQLTALIEKKRDTWEEKLFSERNACTHCQISFDELSARHFSFNSPYGACPRCHGLGTMEVFDETLLIPDPALTLNQGAVHPWRRGGRRQIIYYKALLKAVAKHFDVSMDIPFNEIPKTFRDLLLHGTEEPIDLGYWRGGAYRKYSKPFEGVIPNLERRYEETESDYTRQRLRTYMARLPCKVCNSARLKPESLACTIEGYSIHDLCNLPIANAWQFFDGLSLSSQHQEIAGEVIREIKNRLSFMSNVGLDYLTLNRESGTLSGGEAQRIRLATQIGAGLVGVLYVLDEPSIGLHQRDNEKLIGTLKGLRDLGNTVLVVEHDEQTIREADYVIDLGPGAGRHGGEVTFAGTVEALLKSDSSLTARYLNGEEQIAVPDKRVRPKGRYLAVKKAAENNLKNIHARFPIGLLTCVTGVSGSGKSTLVDVILRRALFQRFYKSKERPGKHGSIEGLEYIDKVIVIDQAPIGRTPRSNPATYTNTFTYIRQIFSELPAAKVRGYKPGRFSFNVKGGRCEKCKGDGILKIEMNFLPDVYVTCEQCRGKRYNRETLEIRYNGKSVADVLEMTINEALEFFQHIPPICKRLQTLSEVGLGYLQLGQSATTLSGGEAQRIKLASELSKRDTGSTVYILDEPTTGLHFADIHKLMHVLEKLRDAGNTVIIIEHNLDVIKRADHIIDLGPEGGDRGGRIVASGTPEKVAQSEKSYTGSFLREVLP